MRIITRLTAALTVGLIAFGSIVYAAEAPANPPQPTYTPLREAPIASERLLEAPIVFRHGDISWLPQLAAEAGWPERTWKRLGQIILRESGGCPNRRGGDAVNQFCEITHVTEWNHRSDTGLLQLNGVHWKQDHPQYAGLICKQMDICTQEPLLDPLTNLQAGLLLWQVAGWQPWKRS